MRARTILAAAAVAFLVATPAAAAPATPQDLADRTEVWLEGELGVPPLFRPIRMATAADLGTCAAVLQTRGSRMRCAAAAWRDGIALDAPIWRGVADAAQWYPGHSGRDLATSDFQTLLHELLHRGLSNDLLEEGLVDSLAYDLMPAATTQLLGMPLPPVTVVYREPVHTVRKASAIACGCSWRSRAARGLRRAWWRADDATRHQVVAAALRAEVMP